MQCIYHAKMLFQSLPSICVSVEILASHSLALAQNFFSKEVLKKHLSINLSFVGDFNVVINHYKSQIRL